MRSARIRLEDIAETIQAIEAALSSASLEQFAGDWVLQKAVERGLEIISEASRGLPEPSKAHHPEVPWAQIAGIGNVLRHAYHRVEPTLVWNIAQQHLPALAVAIQDLLSRSPD